MANQRIRSGGDDFLTGGDEEDDDKAERYQDVAENDDRELSANQGDVSDFLKHRPHLF
jgi:hypothetical protein